MTAEQYQKAHDILGQLRDMPLADATIAAKELCQDDPHLYEYVLSNHVRGEKTRTLDGVSAEELADTVVKISDLYVGKQIGNYKIEALLGRGGMGTVYKATHTLLKRTLAVKILHTHLVSDEDSLRRFLDEPKLQITLEHPNIVRVMNCEIKGNVVFFVMEYIDGMTLDEYIGTRERIPLSEAITILGQILDGIEHAHLNGIVHRDIKPKNILIDSKGHVKITDFGIAKYLPREEFTQTNTVAGTLFYMPPEQLTDLKRADQRSDIYATGMSFLKMLTGRLPFDTDDSYFKIQKNIIDGKILAADGIKKEIPKQAFDFMRKSVARDPLRRFQNVAEMKQALHELRVNRFPVEAEDERTIVHPLIREAQKNNYRIPALITLILLATLAGYYFYSLPPAPPLKENPQVESKPEMSAAVGAYYKRLNAFTSYDPLMKYLNEEQRRNRLAVSGSKEDFWDDRNLIVVVADQEAVYGTFVRVDSSFYDPKSGNFYESLPLIYKGKRAIWIEVFD